MEEHITLLYTKIENEEKDGNSKCSPVITFKKMEKKCQRR